MKQNETIDYAAAGIRCIDPDEPGMQAPRITAADCAKSAWIASVHQAQMHQLMERCRMERALVLAAIRERRWERPVISLPARHQRRLGVTA